MTGPSLLEGLEDAAPKRARRRLPDPRRALAAWCASAWAHPTSRAMLVASALMLSASGALGAYLALRPTPKPDYQDGALDTLFDYTLLTDEFNRLPVDERVALIGQLVSRVKGISGSESVLMAAFAAQISGPARDQLVENASRVFVDLTDRAAGAYDRSLPPAERRAYLESAAVDLITAMRTMSGEDLADVSAQEMLDDARAQAQRDADAARSGRFSADDAGQFAELLSGTLGRHSSVQQKLRMGLFGRDLARTLRGQPLERP